MRIHKILETMYYGGSIDYPENEHGIPYGYTRSPPPVEIPPENSYLKWDGHEWNLTDVPPPVIEVPIEPKIISKLGFLNRLGDDEYVAILAAAKTDVAIEAWINKFNLMGTIDLNDTKIQTTLSMFVTKNLLTQEQMDNILNDPLLPSE
jgi:hypothetical protein